MSKFFLKHFSFFPHDSRGVTLVEVLLAIAVFVVVALGSAELLITSIKYKDVIWEQLSTQNEGRKAVSDFINELRTATLSSIGSYPIEKTSSTEFIFYANIDTDSWNERVRYFLDGANFKKGVNKPTGSPLAYNSATETTTIVAHDIANGTSSLFYYYDQNYAGTSTPMSYPITITNIRMVGIDLTLEENPRMSPAPLHVQATAEIRNLKTN